MNQKVFVLERAARDYAAADEAFNKQAGTMLQSPVEFAGVREQISVR